MFWLVPGNDFAVVGIVFAVVAGVVTTDSVVQAGYKLVAAVHVQRLFHHGMERRA